MFVCACTRLSTHIIVLRHTVYTVSRISMQRTPYVQHVHVYTCTCTCTCTHVTYMYMYIQNLQVIHYCHVQLMQLERQFEQALKKSRGMVIHRMKPDGACLFRAVGRYAHSTQLHNIVGVTWFYRSCMVCGVIHCTCALLYSIRAAYGIVGTYSLTHLPDSNTVDVQHVYVYVHVLRWRGLFCMKRLRHLRKTK